MPIQCVQHYDRLPESHKIHLAGYQHNMISRVKPQTTFFLHGLQRNGFPAGSGVESHLFELRTRQVLENAPNVLVNLEAFQER